MDLIHYIDSEVPLWGEWSSTVQEAPSSVTQTELAGFPDRGRLGLRVSTAAGKPAYAVKNLAIAPGPGDAVYWGFWQKLNALPAAEHCRLNSLENAGAPAACFVCHSDGRCYPAAYADGGDSAPLESAWKPALGRWHYYVLRLRRATSPVALDGEAAFWADGVLVHRIDGIDNCNLLAQLTAMKVGAVASAQNGLVADVDEIKLSTSYAEPHVPRPADEHPSPQRTVVLWNGGSDESRQFADYCAGRLDIPRANLIRLDGASTDEVLPDHETCRTQIEDPVGEYFALNPNVADNCCCFLLGFKVPGCFLHEGRKHSVASRLMRYGLAFSPNAANPLHDLPTVERLTVSVLRSHALYLATRIDADTLAHAKEIVDKALSVSALAALPGSDRLYGDDSDYLQSLACQRLRIQALPVTQNVQFTNDALVWGPTGGATFGAGGSRAVFCDPCASSAGSLRTSSACRDALLAGYAAATGFASDASGLSPWRFFEMLRIGGTVAEAAAVSAEKLDSSLVTAGLPLMIVRFARDGHNLYHGLGGPEAIDWEHPVAHVRRGPPTASVAVQMAPDETHVFAVRAVSRAGVEEQSTHVWTFAGIDPDGNLLPTPLCPPQDVTANVAADGRVALSFSYRPGVPYAAPTAFEVFSDGGTGELDLDNPVATISDLGPGQTDFELWLAAETLPSRFAVRARKDEQVGPLSRTVVAAAAPAPSVPVTL